MIKSNLSSCCWNQFVDINGCHQSRTSYNKLIINISNNNNNNNNKEQEESKLNNKKVNEYDNASNGCETSLQKKESNNTNDDGYGTSQFNSSSYDKFIITPQPQTTPTEKEYNTFPERRNVG